MGRCYPGVYWVAWVVVGGSLGESWVYAEEAVGHAGFDCTCLTQVASAAQEYVGNRHMWSSYMHVPACMMRVLAYAVVCHCCFAVLLRSHVIAFVDQGCTCSIGSNFAFDRCH